MTVSGDPDVPSPLCFPQCGLEQIVEWVWKGGCPRCGSRDPLVSMSDGARADTWAKYQAAQGVPEPDRRYMACATCGFPKPYGTPTVYACPNCGDVGTAIMTTAGAARERGAKYQAMRAARVGAGMTAAERAAEMDRLGFGQS